MQATGIRAITAQSPQSLSTTELGRLSQAIEGWSPQQLNWASGFLAGISSASGPGFPEQRTQDSQTVTILHASQTGNARLIAQRLADSAAARGMEARLVSAHEFKPRAIVDARILVLVISTQGEGDVPENAESLFKFLTGRKAPDLSRLEFSVFGLGDSSYTHFCKAAVDFDEILERLGGKRFLDRLEADVDFDGSYAAWIPNALQALEKLQPAKQAKVLPLASKRAVTRYDRDNPYQATLIENRRLTTDMALTDVRHLVLDIDPDVISYRPGDSLGVWFRNEPSLVQELLETLELDGDSRVRLGDKTLLLRDALVEKRELTLLHPGVVSDWASHHDYADLQSLVGNTDALRSFASGRQFIDLVKEFPGRIDVQVLVDMLKPLQPRLYSIASAPGEYDDEIHLTVSALQYEAHGRSHQGAASGYLIDRIGEDEILGVYVVQGESFRLPDDPSVPVIMIGAGTGIAPFRSFLQGRATHENPGRNWLIFGNRNFREDFLYQTDWIQHRKAGVLEKVSVAFSRDSNNRNYVQDRVLEQGLEILDWLRQGARIYVCGGIDMEKGVVESLKQIVIQYDGKSPTEAEEFYQKLRDEGRYLREVY